MVLSNTLILASTAFLLFVVYVLIKPRPSKSSLSLPPGPKQLPLIGNLHQAPTHDSWLAFQQWTKEHGAIYSLNFGGQTMIMLNSAEAASDLLDKRGNNYSSRPTIPMMGECLSQGLIYILQPYNEKFRTHQRINQSFMNPSMCQKYTKIQELESTHLMHELLSPENNFLDSFERYAASVVYTLMYGKRIESLDQPERQRLEQVITNFLAAGAQGAWIVDLIPALNRLPRFLAPWKRTAEKWRAFEIGVHSSNFSEALTRPSWNWAKHTAANPSAKQLPDLDHAYILGGMYEAGVETTSGMLDVLVLAGIIYPERLQKARAEVDSVCGPDKLPRLQDIAALKHVDAVVKELLRWRPTIPNGFPRVAAQDDEYMGYRIPAGAMVIAHNWSITHDDAVYANADEFRPERWVDEPNLPQHFFGFGRRLCPGKYLGFNNVLLNTARLLWAFDFAHAVDGETGRRVEVDPMAMTQGLNPRQAPFKARIIVRDEKRRETIEREFELGRGEDIDALLNEIKKAS